jgi:hypothetical protein
VKKHFASAACPEGGCNTISANSRMTPQEEAHPNMPPAQVLIQNGNWFARRRLGGNYMLDFSLLQEGKTKKSGRPRLCGLRTAKLETDALRPCSRRVLRKLGGIWRSNLRITNASR